MAFSLHELPEEVTSFLTERHLASFTTLRADGSPHVTPVGFSWDGEHLVARVITSSGSRKVAHIAHDRRVALSQVDRGRWLSLEGLATVTRDPEQVLQAEQRYARRYQAPRPNPQRVVIEVAVHRILGRATPPAPAVVDGTVPARRDRG